VAGGQAGHDAHDLGVAAGQREDALAPAADDEGRTAGGHRLGRPDRAADLVVLTGECGRAVTPQGAHDLEALLQTPDAHRRGIHGDARLLVVRGQPAGAHPELEAAIGDHVERGRLLGQDDGVAEVVVQDQSADAQRGRGFGGHGAGHHGGPLVVQVVRHVEGGVTQVFGLAGQAAPLLSRVGPRDLEREAEGGHGGRSYGVNLVR
jgi:hypothetical protein